MYLLNCCRACLASLTAACDFYDLIEMPELAKKFEACCRISLEIHDNLSTKLCGDCYNKVTEFYEFQMKCIAAAKHARELCALNTLDDEKPIYDLEAQDDLEITITESKLLIEENLAEFNDCESETSPKRKRGRPPKQEQKTEKETQVESSKSSVASFEADNGAYVADCSETPTSPVTTSTFQCDQCSKRFLVEHRFLAHKRKHDGLVAYPCPKPGCERGFNRKNCLTEHLKEHAGDTNVYACDQEGCDKVYKHKTTLVMHLRTSHKVGPELKSAVCEICGKIFKSAAILKGHRYTHKTKSELPFACEQPNCQLRFSNREKVKVHMLRHAGIKNFICPHCGMRKTTRNELKIHINYHTLERTWSCRFCDKVCHSAGNLRMHVRTVHERAKDYACRYCERTFGKPDTRKYHEMTHTGEKPHECELCGKKFTQPAALRTHKKIHLREGNQLQHDKTKMNTPMQQLEVLQENANNL